MPNTRIYIVQKSKPGQHSGSEVLLDSGYSSANGGISLNFQGNPDLFQYYLYAETLDTNFLPDETGTLLEFDKSTMIIQDFTLKEKCWARINFIYKSDASKLSFRVNDKDETHTLLASSFAPVTLLVNPLDAFKLHIKVYFPDGTIKESERDFSGQFYKPLTNINISY
ncbi:MAG: hypothetical protein EP332_02820 [Bacteroidetes bacterium]|nr:MAG: hypothetical protein EP332_02820 [Bacteroidota bacterium]